MRSYSLRLFAIAAVARCASADNGANSTAVVDDSTCGCFLTNGTTPAYYAKHKFFDFRGLSQFAGVPSVVNDSSVAADAPPSSDYFKHENWTGSWTLQNWTNNKGDKDEDGRVKFSGDATVLMVNSYSNVYIENNTDKAAASDTYLTMRTKRLEDFQTAAEFQAQDSNFQFLSLRMLARTIGDAGAVTAMFTYRDSSKPEDVQEADIEILTRDPHDKVQYTNQPSDLPGKGEIKDATRNASMPGDLKWTDWAVYRLDWTPKSSVWFVDGQEVANIAFQAPRDASGVNFNSWGDGGSWSGNMTVGDEASMQIQWIEMVYNTTDKGVQNQKRDADNELRRTLGPRGSLVKRKGGDGECKVVCSIDETAELGKATKLWETQAGAAPRLMAGSVWAWAGMMGLSLWLCGV